MNIRSLTSADLNHIAAIDAQANLSPWSLFSYQQSAANPHHYLVGIYEQQQLIGGCVYSRVDAEAEILQLCINYAKQRQGYAKRLLSEVINQLVTAQAEQIFLEVRCGNTAAINLYLQLGFNVISKRKDYYCIAGKFIDALIMAKQL